MLVNEHQTTFMGSRNFNKIKKVHLASARWNFCGQRFLRQRHPNLFAVNATVQYLTVKCPPHVVVVTHSFYRWR